MHLNHPETIPAPPHGSVEKLSSMKPVPGAKKVGGHWVKQHAQDHTVTKQQDWDTKPTPL